MNLNQLRKIQRNHGGLYLPETEEEIIAIVNAARSDGKKVRVVGSAHSIPEAIYTTPGFPEKADSGFNLCLDLMNRVTVIDASRRRVRVQAGCRLDFDPYSVTGASTRLNGLLPFLDQRGWALGDLGGITHQSLAGYLSTGSAGGSMQHSLYDQIVSIRLVDGRGVIHELNRADPVFYGAVISLGLLGVITEIVLECLPRFDIEGQEAIYRIIDCPFDLEANPKTFKPHISRFLRDKEYCRLMWWPQPTVQKMVVWEARRARIQKSDTAASLPKKKMYRQMGALPDVANFFASQYLKISGNSIFNPRYPGFFRKRSEKLLNMLNLFIIADSEKSGKQKNQPQTFFDSWYHGLPMDYEMDDHLMPTEFTELWLPEKYAPAAMGALREYFDKHGPTATGSYCCEIYASKKSAYWLSPAYATDSVRFDFFWFAKINANGNSIFYSQFWELLKKYKFRLHWAKQMPPQTRDWKRYIANSYPKWSSFYRLREEMDPDKVFLTDYWEGYFQ